MREVSVEASLPTFFEAGATAGAVASNQGDTLAARARSFGSGLPGAQAAPHEHRKGGHHDEDDGHGPGIDVVQGDTPLFGERTKISSIKA